MLTLNTQFDAALRKRIEAEIEQIGEHLANGVALDYADYKYRAGRAQGMKDVLDLCDEVISEMSKQ